jgi:hypothetical protein
VSRGEPRVPVSCYAGRDTQCKLVAAAGHERRDLATAPPTMVYRRARSLRRSFSPSLYWDCHLVRDPSTLPTFTTGCVCSDPPLIRLLSPRLLSPPPRFFSRFPRFPPAPYASLEPLASSAFLTSPAACATRSPRDLLVGPPKHALCTSRTAAASRGTRTRTTA